MAQLAFNEKLAERMEVVYRSRDVLRRRRLVYEALGASPGEGILDVGCGPGFYAAELTRWATGARSWPWTQASRCSRWPRTAARAATTCRSPGRRHLLAGGGRRLPPRRLAADEWAAEQHELEERGAFYFSCTQFCFTGTKGDGDGGH